MRSIRINAIWRTTIKKTRSFYSSRHFWCQQRNYLNIGKTIIFTKHFLLKHHVYLELVQYTNITLKD